MKYKTKLNGKEIEGTYQELIANSGLIGKPIYKCV